MYRMISLPRARGRSLGRRQARRRTRCKARYPAGLRCRTASRPCLKELPCGESSGMSASKSGAPSPGIGLVAKSDGSVMLVQPGDKVSDSDLRPGAQIVSEETV